MGLTSSLSTGLSGLSANQAKLDVIGNNIANINTVGFKSSRLDFQTQLGQTFNYGTPANGDSGGTNPYQVGLGTKQASVSRNFTDGGREVTGVNTNLAIEGNGFFVLNSGSSQVYTRDGSFRLNSQNKLVSGNGMIVQGYGVDSDFNVQTGSTQNIIIPVGGLTLAKATSSISIDGNLNTTGTVATKPATLTMDQTLSGINATTPGATLLTSVTNGTTAYFQSGDVITFNASKGASGGRSLAAKTFTVTATSTLSDLQSFMGGTLGINTTTGINGSAATPGVSVSAGGALSIIGNLGAANDLTLSTSALSIKRGATTLTPFTFTKSATADGESVYTSMTAYDSLGTAIQVGLTATLTSANANGTTWSYLVESPDGVGTGANVSEAVGQGSITFNNQGQLASATTPSLTIDRTGTGATADLTFGIKFDNVTALAGTGSQMASTLQDGSARGTLQNFTIGEDGKITGAFSNGLNRTVGQIALATFRNNQGLVDKGSNNFGEGPNSGTAVISAPQAFSAGRVIAGALEQSNVDLSGEFVNLIGASTGFSGSSRVITTSNQLLQDLLNLVR